MSEVLPDFDDGVPVDDEAEPEDAGVEHLLESPEPDEDEVPEDVQ